MVARSYGAAGRPRAGGKTPGAGSVARQLQPKEQPGALLCPITSRAKGYPFEVPLPEGLSIAGVILVDQIKSLDWRDRVPTPVLADVLDRLAPLLGFE